MRIVRTALIAPIVNSAYSMYSMSSTHSRYSCTKIVSISEFPRTRYTVEIFIHISMILSM